MNKERRISDEGRGGILPWLVSVIAAVLLVVAWWNPSSPLGAVLGWCSIAFFVAGLAIPKHRLTRAFLVGSLAYAGGFYWLYSTIEHFGGFPVVAATSIFSLFVLGSAIQFLIVGFVWSHLPSITHQLGVRTALAWLAAQSVWIRIFPWDFGHTQSGFLPFAQIADIGGVPLITFLMMWFAESLSLRKSVILPARVLAMISASLSVVYGSVQISSIPEFYGPQLRTVMVQGNVSLEKKHDVNSFAVNREQYLKLSKEISGNDTLVVWPESTITDFIPADVPHQKYSNLLPYIGDGSALLVGGLTFLSRSEFFNSSLLIRPDGSVAPPYHKIVLMPFGEYTPLGDLFPFIKEINSTAGQFTAGQSATAMEFSLSSGLPVRITPLICYEDIVPALARSGVLKGGQLLINQTNDAWFGDSVASAQHHMIALFRAIENRRFLLRSTNTGLTAVVDPLGQTLATLPTYTEGTLEMSVNLLSKSTIYTTLGIEDLWWYLGIGVVVIALLNRVRQRMASTN